MKKCISFLLSFLFTINFFTAVVQADTNVDAGSTKAAIETVDNNLDNSNEEDTSTDGQADNETSKEVNTENKNSTDAEAQVEESQDTNNDEISIDNDLEKYKEKNKTNSSFGKEYEKKASEKNKSTRNSSELLKLMEDEDFVEGYEADLSAEVLVNMTDDEYEVAAAKNDGSYVFLDSSDSYTESMEIAENFNDEVNNGTATEDTEYIPCIVDKSGIVVYAVQGIARAIKYINGKQDPGLNVTNLYPNSSLSGGSDGYINASYYEDSPIIASTTNALKVMVNGYVGWAKRDINDGNYDFTVVPINQAVNLSYYYVQNNKLYHYISSDITQTGKGNTLCIGVAPSSLVSGTKYYSYDAHYFYTDVLTLTSDLQEQNVTNENAVNADKVYYNYYQFLPVRSKTSYTASQINSFFNSNTASNSKLRGTGQAIINAQNSYAVNGGIILAVAMNESAKGTSNIALTKNNLFGLNAVDSNTGNANSFNSVDSCITDFAKSWISKGYCDPNDTRGNGSFLGNKAVGINVKYASDPYWGEKASQYYFMFDRWASNFDNNGYSVSKLFDYNNYIIGMYTSSTTVKYKSNNSTAYSVAAKKTSGSEVVGGTVIINSLDSANSRYIVVPSVSSSATGKDGSYDWKVSAYVPKSVIKVVNDSAIENSKLNYTAAVQNIGWQHTKYDGEIAGTVGQGLRMEAIKISLNGDYPEAKLRYRAHVQSIGWQNWVNSGEVAGTTGKSYRMEAIQIEAENLPSDVELQYRVQIQNLGWQDWKRSGETAGTEGKSLRIESIQIRIVKTTPSIEYNAQVQNVGWQGYKTDGETSGTTGQSLRIEALSINLKDYPGASVKYRANLQGKGWQDWVRDGSIAGTIGEARRLEALEIVSEGLSKEYEVQYRAYVQNIGWQDWMSEGDTAGTIGRGLRMEALQVRVVKRTPKVQYRSHVQNVGWQVYVQDGEMAGTTGRSLRMESFQANIVDYPGASINYRAHVQNIGWQNWVSNGAVAGTEGKSLRIEAFQFTSSGLPSGYKLQYRAFVQNIGWMNWVSEGQTAGTEGRGLRIEAIEVKIVQS